MRQAPYHPYLFALWLALLALGIWMENPPDFSALPLADYHAYASLYNHFSAGEEQIVKFPFHARVGMPFLASLLPLPMEEAFLFLNLVLLVAGFGIWLSIWKHMHLNLLHQVIMSLFIGLHFAGPVRLNIYDGVGTDASQFLLIALLSYALIKEKGPLILIALVLFTFLKESTIPLGIFLLMRTYPSYATQRPLFFWIAGGMLLALCILWYLRHSYPGAGAPRWGSLSSVYYYIRSFLLEPWRILLVLASFGMAFGYFPLLMIRKAKWCTDQLGLSLLGLTVTLVALSLLGGQDYTRLVFFAVPPFLSYLFYQFPYSIKQWWPVIALSFVVTCPWQAIPDAAASAGDFSALFMEYASPSMAANRLLWLLAGGGFLGLLQLLNRGSNATDRP